MPSPLTSAKSLARFKSLFAILGVPLEREATSNAPSLSIPTPKMFALRVTIFASSSGVKLYRICLSLVQRADQLLLLHQ